MCLSDMSKRYSAPELAQRVAEVLLDQIRACRRLKAKYPEGLPHLCSFHLLRGV